MYCSSIRSSFSYILLFLFSICSVSTVSAQAFQFGNNRPVIEWDEQLLIRFSDYTPRAMPQGVYLPMSSTFKIETKIPITKLFSSKNYNKNVSCFFDPNNSWVNVKVATGIDLNHQITMFLLHEISARQIRKTLYESSRLKVICGYGKKVYADEIKILRNSIAQYNEETQMGQIKLQQQRWERKLRLELESLSTFCRSCEIRELDQPSLLERMSAKESKTPSEKRRSREEKKKKKELSKIEKQAQKENQEKEAETESKGDADTE